MNGDKLQVGGVILCGGQSRRMGTPKAWLPFAAETLLQRIVRLLSQTVAPVVVVAAPGQELPRLPDGVLLTHDAVSDQGPLQGFCEGLTALSGRADAAFVCSCDAPFLTPGFVQRMIGLLDDRAICVVRAGDFFHPLAAVYRLTILPCVEKLLGEGRRRLLDLLDLMPTRIVSAADLADVDPELRSLRNVNTLEEYQTALREFSSQGP